MLASRCEYDVKIFPRVWLDNRNRRSVGLRNAEFSESSFIVTVSGRKVGWRCKCFFCCELARRFHLFRELLFELLDLGIYHEPAIRLVRIVVVIALMVFFRDVKIRGGVYGGYDLILRSSFGVS